MCKNKPFSISSDGIDDAELTFTENKKINLRIGGDVIKTIDWWALTFEPREHNFRKTKSGIDLMWIDHPSRKRKEINLMYRYRGKCYYWQFPLSLILNDSIIHLLTHKTIGFMNHVKKVTYVEMLIKSLIGILDFVKDLLINLRAGTSIPSDRDITRESDVGVTIYRNLFSRSLTLYLVDENGYVLLGQINPDTLDLQPNEDLEAVSLEFKEPNIIEILYKKNYRWSLNVEQIQSH